MGPRVSGLSADQIVLLAAVARFSGEANWYKVGRATLGKLSSPNRFTEELKALIADALLLEEAVEQGETLPRLRLSEAGERALEHARHEAAK
jgi:hypothetical protein